MFTFQDANWNVTSTVNYAAVPLDRIYTTPYGEPTFDAETINGDGDGDLDASDDSNFDTCNAAADPPTGACRVFDFDNDLDVDSADNTTFDTLYTGSTEIYRQPGRRTSANGFPFAHQGLPLDRETLTYYNRGRQYDPWRKRFTQRDPLTRSSNAGAGLQDGMNVYQYLGGNPTRSLDPSGRHVTYINEHGPNVIIGMDLKFWGARTDAASVAAEGFDTAWNRERGKAEAPEAVQIARASCGLGRCKGVSFAVTSEVISYGSASQDGPMPIAVCDDVGAADVSRRCVEEVAENECAPFLFLVFPESFSVGLVNYCGKAKGAAGAEWDVDIPFDRQRSAVTSVGIDGDPNWNVLGTAHEVGHLMGVRHCPDATDNDADCHDAPGHVMYSNRVLFTNASHASMHSIRSVVRKHADRARGIAASEAWLRCNGADGSRSPCATVDECDRDRGFQNDPGCPPG